MVDALDRDGPSTHGGGHMSDNFGAGSKSDEQDAWEETLLAFGANCSHGGKTKLVSKGARQSGRLVFNKTIGRRLNGPDPEPWDGPERKCALDRIGKIAARAAELAGTNDTIEKGHLEQAAEENTRKIRRLAPEPSAPVAALRDRRHGRRDPGRLSPVRGIVVRPRPGAGRAAGGPPRGRPGAGRELQACNPVPDQFVSPLRVNALRAHFRSLLATPHRARRGLPIALARTR